MSAEHSPLSTPGCDPKTKKRKTLMRKACSEEGEHFSHPLFMGKTGTLGIQVSWDLALSFLALSYGRLTVLASPGVVLPVATRRQHNCFCLERSVTLVASW